MKKLVTAMILGVAVFAFAGCGEKTTEEKVNDAAADMQKDAESAAKDADKAVESTKEDGMKALDKLTD